MTDTRRRNPAIPGMPAGLVDDDDPVAAAKAAEAKSRQAFADQMRRIRLAEAFRRTHPEFPFFRRLDPQPTEAELAAMMADMNSFSLATEDSHLLTDGLYTKEPMGKFNLAIKDGLVSPKPYSLGGANFRAGMDLALQALGGRMGAKTVTLQQGKGIFEPNAHSYAKKQITDFARLAQKHNLAISFGANTTQFIMNYCTPKEQARFFAIRDKLAANKLRAELLSNVSADFASVYSERINEKSRLQGELAESRLAGNDAGNEEKMKEEVAKLVSEAKEVKIAAQGDAEAKAIEAKREKADAKRAQDMAEGRVPKDYKRNVSPEKLEAITKAAGRKARNEFYQEKYEEHLGQQMAGKSHQDQMALLSKAISDVESRVGVINRGKNELANSVNATMDVLKTPERLSEVKVRELRTRSQKISDWFKENILNKQVNVTNPVDSVSLIEKHNNERRNDRLELYSTMSKECTDLNNRMEGIIRQLKALDADPNKTPAEKQQMSDMVKRLEAEQKQVATEKTEIKKVKENEEVLPGLIKDARESAEANYQAKLKIK